MSARDEFADWDAAYVLGALSAADRARFEDHLAGCAPCRASVAEIAGMPGLLAQVPAGEALAIGSPEEVLARPPASLMPELPRVVGPGASAASRSGSRSRARRWWVSPLAAAAAALLIGGVAGYAVSQRGSEGAGVGDRSGVVLAAPQRMAFAPVADDIPMTAVVDVVPLRQGTELRIECQYSTDGSTTGSGDDSSGRSGNGSGGKGADDSRPTSAGASVGSGSVSGSVARTDARYGVGSGPRYSLWVLDRTGRGTQVKAWTAQADTVMHPVALSNLDVAQISSLEIRLADSDTTVLRAALS
jgi:hypothetical protein